MIKPLISVIVPTLNEEKYAEKCLFSLSNQNFDNNYEIIVVDGHSKDKTVEITKKYADKILKCKKRNVAAQRNFGAKQAKGDILAFIDSDTVASPNWLRSISNVFEDNHVVAATGPIYPLENTKIRFLYQIMNELQSFLIKIDRPMFAGASCAFRKDNFDEISGFNEKLHTCEDHDISLRIRKRGKIKFAKSMIVFTSNRRFDSKQKIHTQTGYYVNNTINYFLKKPKKYIEIR